MNVLLTCKAKRSAKCKRDACMAIDVEKAKQKIQSLKTLSNIPFRVRVRGVVKSFTLSLVFVGLPSSRECLDATCR